MFWSRVRHKDQAQYHLIGYLNRGEATLRLIIVLKSNQNQMIFASTYEIMKVFCFS